jgi:hypothetical protein
MDDGVFRGWDNYFLMVGSAAAGLIGLLFLAVTLTSGLDRSKASRGASLYMTPTAAQFVIVFIFSALAMAPRIPIALTSLLLGLAALVALANAVWSCIELRKGIPGGEPAHWSDFWSYGVVPAILYVGFAVGAAALARRASWAVLVVALISLAQLLMGVRNAWDLVTWLAPRQKSER